MDMETLFDTVDQLSEEERLRLLSYLTTGYRNRDIQQSVKKGWTFDLFPGAFKTDDSFDDPLPDSFWLGEECTG